jgi:hypothetical protein
MRLKVKMTLPTARIVIVGVRSRSCGQSGRKNWAPRFVALKFWRACPSQPTIAAPAATRRVETAMRLTQRAMRLQRTTRGCLRSKESLFWNDSRVGVVEVLPSSP